MNQGQWVDPRLRIKCLLRHHWMAPVAHPHFTNPLGHKNVSAHLIVKAVPPPGPSARPGLPSGHPAPLPVLGGQIHLFTWEGLTLPPHPPQDRTAPPLPLPGPWCWLVGGSTTGGPVPLFLEFIFKVGGCGGLSDLQTSHKSKAAGPGQQEGTPSPSLASSQSSPRGTRIRGS